MNIEHKIYVSGHTGLVGSAILRALREQGYNNLVLRTRTELDLRNQDAVNRFFADERPQYVFHCAAKVGGILENQNNQADFLYDNMMISGNVLKAAHESDVKRVLNMGSACVYPKYAENPIRESALLTGSLERTNEGYAIAKIAALKLCEHLNTFSQTKYLTVMPTNLYGSGYKSTHVIPDLIRKFHDAKVNKKKAVRLYGDGTPLREFLHVDDCAAACIKIMENIDAIHFLCSSAWINIGSGEEVSIRYLVNTIARMVDYTDLISWDRHYPNGVRRRLLDCSRLHICIDWKPRYNLESGLEEAYKSFCQCQ